ncbi:Lysine-specific demethylase 5A, partial [Desmophyllum pertusum]
IWFVNPSKVSLLTVVEKEFGDLFPQWMRCYHGYMFGMCFSSFVWHNEDHWKSIQLNYMHWVVNQRHGMVYQEIMPKILSVQSERAAPELFEAQPDLLHQLVTIIQP